MLVNHFTVHVYVATSAVVATYVATCLSEEKGIYWRFPST